jgi:carbon-monoxide dehydrogenase medium subunit
MKAGAFEFEQFDGLEQTLKALADSGAARPLAGGQSLVPMLNLRLAPADLVVDLTHIAALREAKDLGASVLYGAMVRHADFEDGRVPDSSNGLMRHVAGRFAYRAVRNRGTIGGALALADPAADWLTTVVLLNATLHLASARGSRAVAASDFVIGSYMTVLEEGELLTGVEISRLSSATNWGYYKVMRKTGEYADSLAMVVADRAAGMARVVLGAVDGAPMVLARTAQAVLSNASISDIASTVREELAACDREFPAHKIILHSTAVCRAIDHLKRP